MRLILTRDFGADGRFVLSRRAAVVARVQGTRRQALYPAPGEPYWLTHLCPEGVEALFGPKPLDLAPGASMMVELNGDERSPWRR